MQPMLPPRYKIAILLAVFVAFFGAGFILLSGSNRPSFVIANDATHPEDSVDSATIVNNSITSADIAQNTLSILNFDTDLQNTIANSASGTTVLGQRLKTVTDVLPD